MPIYDYDCAACGRRFEVDPRRPRRRPDVLSAVWQGPVRKAITAATVHYKGSGWAKKERRDRRSDPASSKTGGRRLEL